MSSKGRIRVGLVTSETARSILSKILGQYELDVDWVILSLPVAAIGYTSTRTIARLLTKYYGEELRRVDLIVVPGLSPGKVSEISNMLGVKAIRGPKDPGLVPILLEEIARGAYKGDPEKPYEYMSIPKPASVEAAFTIGDVKVPRRAPPLIIATEIPPSTPPSEAASIAERVARDGAQLIVIGATPDDPLDAIVDKVKAASRYRPVLCELPRADLVRDLWDAGCAGFSVSSRTALTLAEGGGVDGELVFIVGDRDIDRLAGAVQRLKSAGARKIIVDPVVGIPLIDFSSTFKRYSRARSIGEPLLFSAANAIEEVSADPHSLHLLLASSAIEVGASVYLVVEDSYKSVHTTSEALLASQLASYSYQLGRPPKDVRSPLLVVRQETRPPGPPDLRPDEEIRVDSFVPPILEPGKLVIAVDYSRGELVVYYERDGKRTLFRGSHPLSLTRVIVRETGIGPEHAAYLGFELYKAWLGLRTGKTYLQDEELIVLPWERLSLDSGERSR
ncbi:MAG: hypothetical protein F7C35_01890 [Desulfurococcales archaeon]|nr:hypothetical protein [Desulfurococcales archaeon]